MSYFCYSQGLWGTGEQEMLVGKSWSLNFAVWGLPLHEWSGRDLTQGNKTGLFLFSSLGGLYLGWGGVLDHSVSPFLNNTIHHKDLAIKPKFLHVRSSLWENPSFQTTWGFWVTQCNRRWKAGWSSCQKCVYTSCWCTLLRPSNAFALSSVSQTVTSWK